MVMVVMFLSEHSPYLIEVIFEKVTYRAAPSNGKISCVGKSFKRSHLP